MVLHAAPVRCAFGRFGGFAIRSESGNSVETNICAIQASYKVRSDSFPERLQLELQTCHEPQCNCGVTLSRDEKQQVSGLQDYSRHRLSSCACHCQVGMLCS